MEFRPQQIADCYVIAPEPVADDRGSFARVFSADEFGDRGLEMNIWQMNLSRCHAGGTIRGIHWQAEPHSEAKLARCVRGRVFDVCVDVRSGSDSLGSWVGVELTPENQLAMYVPPGCGHGYQAMEPGSELLYSTSGPYVPDAERGVRWNDPTLGIDWPLKNGIILSDKDRTWPDFKGH